MVTEDQPIVAAEAAPQVPPVVATQPPVVPAQDAPAPIALVDAPPERVPVNLAAMQARQQAQPQQPAVRVVQPRADGQVPANLGKGKFVVAQATEQPATPPIQPQVPSPAPQTEAPQSVAGVPDAPAHQTPAPSAPVVSQDWEALTGGQLKTQSDWETFQAEKARLAVEVQQLTESRVVFANPLAEKINEVFKNGGDMATVANIVAAQKLDPSAMKPLEAIKAAIGFQHPDLDHEEVEAHIGRLGIDLSDPEGPGTRAAIKTEAAKAAQYLAGLKVQMDNPAVLSQAKEAQAEQIRNQEAWKVAPIPAQTTRISEKVGEIAVSTEFALSQEARAFADQVTAEYKRSLPATPQNIQNYLSLHETLARGFDSQRLISHVTAEAVRVASLEAQKRVAGPTPPPVPHATPPQPAVARYKGHFALGES